MNKIREVIHKGDVTLLKSTLFAKAGAWMECVDYEDLCNDVERIFLEDRLRLLDTIVGEAEDILQTERFSGVPIALNKLIERLQEAREALKTKGE